MNAPELVFRANPSRRWPGVKVPVAAPNIAVDLTSAPSCVSERPLAAGNCEAFGCSAAASSSTAGGRAAAEEVVVRGAVGFESDDVLVEEEEPQPASAIAPAASVARTR